MIIQIVRGQESVQTLIYKLTLPYHWRGLELEILLNSKDYVFKFGVSKKTAWQVHLGAWEGL